MEISLSREINIDCPICSKSFNSDIWLIVDLEEMPRFTEKIKNNRLHCFQCPVCEEDIFVDQPIFIYLPSDDPRIIFSTKKKVGHDFSNDEVLELIDLLIERIGDESIADDIKKPQSWQLRSELAETFEDYPELTLRERKQEGEEALKKFEEDMPDEYLDMIMRSYFETPDWNKRIKMVDHAPILLTEAVETYCQNLTAYFKEHENPEAEGKIVDNLDILIRARKIGYAEAVEEFFQKCTKEQRLAHGFF